MLHRLPPSPGLKPPLNEIQPNLDPFEVLFDVKKLMDEANVWIFSRYRSATNLASFIITGTTSQRLFQ